MIIYGPTFLELLLFFLDSFINMKYIHPSILKPLSNIPNARLIIKNSISLSFTYSNNFIFSFISFDGLIIVL